MSSRPSSASWLSASGRVAGVLLAVSPFLPPLLERAGMPRLAAMLDQPWQGLCHRMPERSLTFLGEIMPLCTRCLGLVVGFGAGLAIAWPHLSVRALRITVSLACTFLFLELTTQDLGWHPVFHPTRLLSGLLVAYPVGAALGGLLSRVSAPRLDAGTGAHVSSS